MNYGFVKGWANVLICGSLPTYVAAMTGESHRKCLLVQLVRELRIELGISKVWIPNPSNLTDKNTVCVVWLINLWLWHSCCNY